MGFPEVGIKIILDKTGWGGPFNSTLREAQKIDKVFAHTSKSVSDSGKKIGGSINDLVASFMRGNDALGITEKQMSLVAQSIGALEKQLKKMGATGLDVNKFWEGIREGKNATDALAAAAQGVVKKIDILGFSLSKGAIAAAGAATAFTILFKVVKQGVEDYQELGNEVRLLQYEIGGVTSQSTAWLRVMDRAGVSTRSFMTVVGMLEKNLVDTELRMAEGLESTTQFTRAMKTMGVATHEFGKLREVSDIMEDIAQWAVKTGPGLETNGVLMAAMGRSGKQLFPVLYEIADGLQRAKEENVILGTEMSSLDKEMTDQARIVDTDLKSAWKGISVLIGREVTPGFTELKRGAIEILVRIRQLTIHARALNKALTTVGPWSKDFDKVFQDEFGRLAGLGTEASRAAEELKIAQDKAAGAAVLHAEKLDLFNDKLKESQQELNDLADTFRDRRADLVLQFGEPGELGGRRWDDILLQRSRALEDWYTQDFRKRRDAYISWTQKQEDIFRRHARREIDVTKEGKDKLEEFEKDANKRREDLAREHGRRLRDINQEYLDTVQEAARRNDAVGVVRAMRERAKGIRDEGTKYRDEQEDLRRSLDEKLDEIKKSNEEQKQALRDNLAEQLEDLEISLKRQQDAYLRNLDDQRADRATAYRREEEDFNRTKQRQFDDLNAWYNKEEQALRDHMIEMARTANEQLQAGIVGMLKTYDNGIMMIYEGAVGGASQAAQNASQQGFNAPGPAMTGSTGLTPWEQWKQRQKYLRAEGGMDIVSGPTSFTFGEGGSPEAILSVPLRGQVTHSHQFSPLKVGLEGVPAGTNPQQMQSMMWQMMVDMIKQVG